MPQALHNPATYLLVFTVAAVVAHAIYYAGRRA